MSIEQAPCTPMLLSCSVLFGTQPCRPCDDLSFAMQGEATVPSNLGDEFDTNPFLRPGDLNIRKSLGKQSNMMYSPLPC